MGTALSACSEKQAGMVKILLNTNTKYITNLKKSVKSVLLKRCSENIRAIARKKHT